MIEDGSRGFLSSLKNEHEFLRDWLSVNYQQNFNVSNLNSFNLPVTAEYFCTVYSLDELASANAFAKNNNLGVTVLGEGTNIILPSFVVGLVIKVEIKGINIDDSKDFNGIISCYILAIPFFSNTLISKIKEQEKVVFSS